MKSWPSVWRILCPVIACAFVLVCITVLPAEAGPGGIIKEVGRSFWGQVGMVALVVLLSPLIIWYLVKRSRHIKRVKADLELLATKYRQYNWLDINDRTIAVFTWVWSAWSQQKMSNAKLHTTNWYWQNQQLQLDQWEAKGLRNVCELKKITSVEPLLVQHVDSEDGNGSRVVVQVMAQVIDYVEEMATGKVVQGDKKVGDLETIWTLMWEDGFWKLNLIESNDKESIYLDMTSKLPQALTAGREAQSQET